MNYKQRITDALNKYLSRENCPICGLQHWNGYIHAYAGVFKTKVKDQLWCNGKLTFKSGQKENKEG
jgi:hypothetical protein